MMTKEIIFKKIEEILKEKMSIETAITMDTALIADDILDSMEFLKYLTVIEEEFNISITDEELENQKLGIISNMIDYLSLKG